MITAQASAAIEEKISQAERRGQRVSPAVRSLMHAWALHDPKLPNTGSNKGKNPNGLTCISAGLLPIPCDCLSCGDPAVIFPPDDDAPNGYCICPACTFGAGRAANANE